MDEEKKTMNPEEIVKLINELCVTDFVLLRNKGKEHASKLWVENSDETKHILLDIGMTEDEIAANVHEYGIDIAGFTFAHGIIYLPDFGFAVVQ